MRRLLEKTTERAIAYLEGLASRPVAPTGDAVARLRMFDEPLPDDPTTAESVLQLLDDIGSPATMATAGPRFFGFVIGGSLPVTLAANWLAGTWDQNSALHNVTPGTALLEEVALKWLLDLFDLPSDCAGTFVTGATLANFCSLAAARHAVLAKTGWDVEADGDPFEEICGRAHEAGAWVHVDGAFGLWAIASPELKYLTRGIAEADSWVTDAHKWLNVPYDSGLAIVRDADALRAAMSITASYLPTEAEGRNPSDYTPELSRRARGVEVWAALRSLGRSGVSSLIERTCRYARRFAEGLEAAGYPILNEVVLNQVLVSFGDALTTMQVIQQIQAEGTSWCGSTVWQGHTAMRISVSSWATSEPDVDLSLDAMLRVATKFGT